MVLLQNNVSNALQGVMRTYETLLRFKMVSEYHQPSVMHPLPPLLHYCTALMQVALGYPPISLKEAIECVKCALSCSQHQQVYHWIAQGMVGL